MCSNVCRKSEKHCLHKQPCETKQQVGHCNFRHRQKRLDIIHGTLLPTWQELMRLAKDSAYIEKETAEGCAAPRSLTSCRAML
jgi:hypothetical protein